VRARMAIRESGRKGGLFGRVDSPGSAISAGKFDFSHFFFSVLNFDGFFHCWVILRVCLTLIMNEYKEVLLGDHRISKVKGFWSVCDCNCDCVKILTESLYML